MTDSRPRSRLGLLVLALSAPSLFHVGNVLRKLDAVSRTETVVRARERGIVP